MTRRVYIHQTPVLDGRRRAAIIGSCIFAVIAVLAIQARLTFSEHALAQARDELGTFSQGVEAGVIELAPAAENVAEVKDAVSQAKDAFTQQLELQNQLNAAAAAAANELEKDDAIIPPITTGDAELGSTPEPVLQPETSTTTP